MNLNLSYAFRFWFDFAAIFETRIYVEDEDWGLVINVYILRSEALIIAFIEESIALAITCRRRRSEAMLGSCLYGALTTLAKSCRLSIVQWEAEQQAPKFPKSQPKSDAILMYWYAEECSQQERRVHKSALVNSSPAALFEPTTSIFGKFVHCTVKTDWWGLRFGIWYRKLYRIENPGRSKYYALKDLCRCLGGQAYLAEVNSSEISFLTWQ